MKHYLQKVGIGSANSTDSILEQINEICESTLPESPCQLEHVHIHGKSPHFVVSKGAKMSRVDVTIRRGRVAVKKIEEEQNVGLTNNSIAFDRIRTDLMSAIQNDDQEALVASLRLVYEAEVESPGCLGSMSRNVALMTLESAHGTETASGEALSKVYSMALLGDNEAKEFVEFAERVGIDDEAQLESVAEAFVARKGGSE